MVVLLLQRQEEVAALLPLLDELQDFLVVVGRVLDVFGGVQGLVKRAVHAVLLGHLEVFVVEGLREGEQLPLKDASQTHLELRFSVLEGTVGVEVVLIVWVD